MSEPPRILLEHRLKMLKLRTFLREYEKVARHSAHEGLDHVQFLSRLVELELIDRERRLVERRIKAAKFRHRSKSGNSSLHTRAGASRGIRCSGCPTDVGAAAPGD